MAEDTKTIIAESFDSLVRKLGIDKVTVKAVIEDCGVSRQTFYYHFQDIMDVVEWSAQRAAQRMVERSLAAATPQEALSELIRAISENRELLHKLIVSQRRAQVERIIFKTVRTYLEKMLVHCDTDIQGEYRDAELALDFLSFGLVGTLIQHCSDPQLDPDKLAGQLIRILGDRI